MTPEPGAIALETRTIFAAIWANNMAPMLTAHFK